MALCSLTFVSLDQLGRARRRFSPREEVIEVARPEQTLDAWRERGLRGRTLVLFGPFPHLWRTSYSDGAPRGPQGFVELAALENVVRRVYFLVPDEDWEVQFGGDLPGFYRRVPGVARGLYMHYSLGLPVVATTPSSLPRLHEPALVYVDQERFDLASTRRVLARKGIVSDLIVASRGM
ncbi:MAG TPA: hypothetical protein VLT61_15925 [Anaeromyxobacteraceae bacterium]|nr:hypothetical protein [Anaeromyxobacteraceae bacterium]